MPLGVPIALLPLPSVLHHDPQPRAVTDASPTHLLSHLLPSPPPVPHLPDNPAVCIASPHSTGNKPVTARVIDSSYTTFLHTGDMLRSQLRQLLVSPHPCGYHAHSNPCLAPNPHPNYIRAQSRTEAGRAMMNSPPSVTIQSPMIYHCAFTLMWGVMTPSRPSNGSHPTFFVTV